MTEGKSRVGARWAGAVAGVSAIGVAVSAYLTQLHLDLFYGEAVGGALCDFGEGFNCSTVNASPESEVFGIPQSLLAVPVYIVAAGLGLVGARQRDSAAAVTLTGLGLLSVLYSAHLAWISATVIGAWCLFCIVLYAVNASLLALGAWGAGLGPAALFRALVAAPVTAFRIVGGGVAAGSIVLGLAWMAYDHVRDGMAEAAAAAAVAQPEASAASTASVAAATSGTPGNQTKKVKLGAGRADLVAPIDAPSIGPASARVTIVELADFQCPFCKRLAGSLHQLRDEYPDDVRLVYVDYPLNLDCTRATLKRTMHPEACNAAAAGVCASRQGKFWEAHDRLWERQGELRRKTYLEIADELGLNRDAYTQCLDDPKTKEAILAATDLGARLGVTGTPTFFVNGRQMSGGQPIEVLRAVVDAELAGNKAALDLEVAVGTETIGPVTATADAVGIAGLAGGRIDTFEASLDGARAVSRPGVEPARNVSWYDAKAACESAGKRLCTEREWLAACTGAAPVDADRNGIASDDPILGRKYGYGDARLAGACADSRNPEAVGELLTGNHPRCGTPEGVYDLVGGVKEWVGLTPATAATKGGSYSSAESARCAYFRDDLAPDTKDASTGFRCCSGPPDPAPPEVRAGRDVGEKLDAFDVELLDGKRFKSRSLAGKPAVVTFWASWCAPCQKEMPALATLYEKYKDKGLQILGVSVDQDEKKLATWLGAHPMPFLIARDPGGVLMETFPNRGLPTTLWIRRDGTIRLRTTGLPPGGDKRLEELVAELVGD